MDYKNIDQDMKKIAYILKDLVTNPSMEFIYDLEKAERFEKMYALAENLKEKCEEVKIEVMADPLINHAGLILRVPFIILDDDNEDRPSKSVFTEMIGLADSVLISTATEENVYFDLSITNVWTKAND